MTKKYEDYDRGWIKLFRATRHKGWYRKSEYVHLWIHLLLKANHQPNEWVYKNETYMIKPGQFITSRKALSTETSINESKVERILKLFKIEQQIEQQNFFTSRLITITNWSKYQNNEQQIEQPVNSQRTASEQPVNTNRECKNEKNDKNVKKSMAKKKFIPPTLEEVREFISINTLKVCPDTFFKYFEAGDWIDSKGNPVRSWKQKILTWASRTNTITNRIPTNKKIYTAEESRVISPEEEHRMEIEFLRHINQ